MSIVFQNDKQLITSTNYFETEHAKSGLCFLSVNAGAIRLLLPASLEKHLVDMKDTSVEIEKNIERTDSLVVWFDDRTDAPFRLQIDYQMCDHVPKKDTWDFFVYDQNFNVLLKTKCKVLN